MKSALLPTLGLLCLLPIAAPRASAADQPEPPREWIDPATGHRIVRLSNEPGSASLYFHQNAYTPEGDKLIIVTPGGLSTVNLKTREVELVVPGVRYGMGSSAGIEVGRKTRTVYYQKNVDGHTVIYATNVDTKAPREIATLSFTGEFGGVNTDETLIFGKCAVPTAATSAPAVAQNPPPALPPPTAAPAAGGQLQGRRGGRGGGPRVQQFFTVDLKTGAVKTFHQSTDNLNHDQCSPTDPDLALFCHEGEWHNVDRIWTIHLDGTGARLMHPRTMQYEIAGHEFFSHDGQMVLYDLQTPRSSVFWLAGVNVYNGERIRYSVERPNWSVHYNVSWDGKLFAGDGGGPTGVGNRTPLPEAKQIDPPVDSQWIFSLRPEKDSARNHQGRRRGREDRQVRRGETRRPLEAQLPARAQPHVHARRQVDCLPFQHARPNPCLRRRGEKSGVKRTSPSTTARPAGCGRMRSCRCGAARNNQAPISNIQ